MAGRAPAAHVERAAAVDEAQQSYTGLLRRCHSLRGKIGSREDEGHVGRDFRQPGLYRFDNLAPDAAGLVPAGGEYPPGGARPAERNLELQDEAALRFRQLGTAMN